MISSEPIHSDILSTTKLKNFETLIRSKYNSNCEVLSLNDQVLLMKRSKIWTENKLKTL